MLSRDPISKAARVEAPKTEATSSPPRWPFGVVILWMALSGLYITSYRDEKAWLVPFKVGGLIAVVVLLILGIVVSWLYLLSGGDDAGQRIKGDDAPAAAFLELSLGLVDGDVVRRVADGSTLPPEA